MLSVLGHVQSLFKGASKCAVVREIETEGERVRESERDRKKERTREGERDRERERRGERDCIPN